MLASIHRWGSAMRKYQFLAILLIIGLSACSAPLYSEGVSTVEITSAKSPDLPAPHIHKMYLLVDMGATGLIPFGTFYLTAKDFGDAIAHEADACHVHVPLNFEERWKIIKPELPILSDTGRANIMKIDHSKIVDLNPEAVLVIGNASQTITEHMGRKTLTNYAYHAELEAYPSGKAFWKATVNLHPRQSEELGSAEEILARNIIKRLANDGILKDCPSAQVSQQ